MNEGDLVLQPPGIRHRVLESSPGLEVVEISAPALHETFADHELTLPNGETGGSSLCRSAFPAAHRGRHALDRFPRRRSAANTSSRTATCGIAEARLIRPGIAPEIAFSPHRGELVFGFVLDGTASLNGSELRSAECVRGSTGRALDPRRHEPRLSPAARDDGAARRRRWMRSIASRIEGGSVEQRCAGQDRGPAALLQ